MGTGCTPSATRGGRAPAPARAHMRPATALLLCQGRMLYSRALISLAKRKQP
ncbi:MAG: hypothetical protein BMS9Abin10_0318 [Gammaproteobacteria bacterium]|nr:MAG: hypothetical protein BMS9Abin10_0318 [Gammaproteobacteria bacterium]